MMRILRDLPVAPIRDDIRYLRPNSRMRDAHSMLAIRAKPAIGFAAGGADCGAVTGAVD